MAQACIKVFFGNVIAVSSSPTIYHFTTFLTLNNLSLVGWKWHPFVLIYFFLIFIMTFCFPYRWGIAFLWSFGGSSVSETPLWTATSYKGDLAGLPPRSPPLPPQVCRVEIQLHRLFFLLVCLLAFFLISRQASNWQPRQHFYLYLTSGQYCSLVHCSFLSISFSFSDRRTDNVWWPLSNPQ